jgi:hypothetical protein
MDNFGDGYDESSDIEDYSHLEPIYEKCLWCSGRTFIFLILFIYYSLV